MISIQQIDTRNKADVERFVRFHYQLYSKCPQWVPPFYNDIRLMLNPDKHPFYEHSQADFFVATQGDEVVGRIAMLENKPFNAYHQKKDAEFYLFDSVDDQQVANALFERGFEWARQRGLENVVGPKGFSPFDGYGILYEGAEYRQMMTMMNYNYPYYVRLIETIGFEKEVDFVSCSLRTDQFGLPEKVHEVARRVVERGKFKVIHFEKKSDLKKWIAPIKLAYNKTFINNWEYYPLTQNEVDLAFQGVLSIAVPKLIKIITYEDEVVGFLFGFPDISAALQRQKGKITPWGLVDYMLELKRTRALSLNGAGVLPQYHGRGGNALLYSEMEKTVKESGYEETEMTQVAETASQMRKDLITAGGKAYKNHRVYHKAI